MFKKIEISKFLPTKNRLIGLDIGSSSIKLAELTHQQGKLVVINLKFQEIDLSIDNSQAQLNALKNVFQGIKAKDAKISVVINCSASCTKVSVIPFMPISEITQALKWEMKKSLSFPIDQAVIDYKILEEIDEGGVKKLKVAVACCPQETVDRFLDLLNKAGITPSVFTQHSFALKNVIANLNSQDKKIVALLDIGYNFSELVIFHNNELVFSRKLPVAGRDFTRQMTQPLVSDIGKIELSFEEAEETKKKYGLVNSADQVVLDEKITSTQLIPLLRPNLEKLTTEIERSFTFYREKEQGATVESLALLGGGGNLKNLANYLTENLRIPVQFGDPVDAFAFNEPSLLTDEPETANRFASALGAALASSNDINLLPVEMKQQTSLLIKRSSIKALVTAIIVIFILVYTGMRIKLGVYDERIATAQLELATLSPQIEQLPKQIFLSNILNQRIYWGDALKEISNLIPGQVYLTELSAIEKELTLKGEIKAPGLLREQILIEFIHSLEKGIFKKVKLISSRDSSEENLNTFELKLGFE